MVGSTRVAAGEDEALLRGGSCLKAGGSVEELLPNTGPVHRVDVGVPALP